MTRLLLVEDNAGDARLIQELLRELVDRAYTVTHAATLGDALRSLSGHDVALVDLTLPDATGITTVQRLASADRALPIVVLTGNADERVGIEALTAGAQDYLRKGELAPTLLDKALRYAMERKRLTILEIAQQNAEQTVARARFVAEVTAASSISLEAEACARAVAPLLVPALADGCRLDLVRDGQVIEIASAGEPQGAEVLEIPLRARGQAIGSLVLWMASSRRLFGDDDRMLAEEVSDRLALGIDNATLFANANRALRGRDELMAIVSHDLRNPLGVVQLALTMLEGDPRTLPAALPRATRAVERMRLLIEDLLQISQIESGTLKVEPRLVELGPVLDDVYEQHRLLGSGKGIQLQRALTPSLGSVVVDPNRLTQALGNLLGNAIKFTPADGEVTLAAAASKDGVEISVTDTGPGIPADDVPRIFERFWQADRRRSDGVGLGLPITKGIVDALGGRLEVKSELGRGTTFRITLPSPAS